MPQSLPEAKLTATPVEISPRPTWVLHRNRADPTSSNLQTTSHYSSPQSYFLLDYQIAIGTEESACFQRMCLQIHDESCIENMSQFLYHLAPGSQQLCFHSCVIYRNDETIDCLDEENIRCMQRETELERHISSDQLTVEFIIDDLRVGDLIDIETTIIETCGSHPLYGHYFRQGYSANRGVPVALQSVRVINKSSDHNVIIQQIDTAQSIDQKTVLKPSTTYEKQWLDLTPQSAGACLPTRYWPSCVMIATATDWPAVSAYLHDYYTRQGLLDDALDLSAISELEYTVVNKETILRYIRFVQENIRYRSESSGIFSHTPKLPSVTLKRRTGDCKDKSTLLLALLARIGVHAELALVNTSLHDAVDMLTPSPFLFDHMIVKICWKQQRYFVDATLQKQGGNLDVLAPLPYRKALILTAEGATLENIIYCNDAQVLSIQHTVDLRAASETGPTIEVIRTYHSNRANSMRYYFASTANKIIESSFMEGLADDLGITLSAIEPVHIELNNLNDNILRTRELYRVETPLDKIDSGSLEIVTSFYQDLQIPSSDATPVAIVHDGVMEHHIKVLYGKKVAIDPEQYNQTNAWFTYQDRIIVTDTELDFHMRLIPGKEIIETDQLGEYRENYKCVVDRSRSRFPVKIDSNETLGLIFLSAAILVTLAIVTMNGLISEVTAAALIGVMVVRFVVSSVL